MKTAKILALLLSFMSISAQAAYIHIDDSDVDTITITATGVDFFMVNDQLVIDNSITLNDGIPHAFGGSWLDLDFDIFPPLPLGTDDPVSGLMIGPSHLEILAFGIGNVPYSGVGAMLHSDGFFGWLEGLFIGFDPLFWEGEAILPEDLLPLVHAQDGLTRSFTFGTLTVDFTSEAAQVPEPAMFGLLALGLAGLGLRRRRTFA